MKKTYLYSLITFLLLFLLILSCEKKNEDPAEEVQSNFSSTSTTGGSTTSGTTGSSTTGGTTTGGTTTGGTTTGGSSTTGGSTTGGSQKGAIIFHKSEDYVNPLYLYFEGEYQGILGSSSKHSNPTCNTNGCIVKTNLPYQGYSWYAQVRAADGVTVLYTKSGYVTLNSSCVAVNASEW